LASTTLSEELDAENRDCCNERVSQRWDAGDMGCGQLVFELRRRLTEMTPGETLELVAESPGAPSDLPAWCRMTGHTLLSAEHPNYVIKRRDE
jgi:tRNA 2-thiouridine synthesizing protein A